MFRSVPRMLHEQGGVSRNSQQVSQISSKNAKGAREHFFMTKCKATNDLYLS